MCIEEREIARLLKPCVPWYFKHCVREFEEAGVRDIMLDLELMCYFAVDELPYND